VRSEESACRAIDTAWARQRRTSMGSAAARPALRRGIVGVDAHGHDPHREAGLVAGLLRTGAASHATPRNPANRDSETESSSMAPPMVNAAG
jgi:hypothetical protein